MSFWQKIKVFFGGKKADPNPFWNFERSSPRCDINLFIRPKGEQEYREYQGDVGLGGFAFRSEESFPPQTEVDVKFILPNASVAIKSTGETLNLPSYPHDGTVRGIFIQMQIEDKRLLARWLYDSALAEKSK